MEQFLNEHKWGGSGIERVVFEHIMSILPKGSKVLEFGAGASSTPALMRLYDLTTIESNKLYANINPKTIYAEDKDGEYDFKKISKLGSFDLILIDGVNRVALLDNLKVFKGCNYIVIHDTYRERETELAKALAIKLKKTVTFYTDGDYWAVIK